MTPRSLAELLLVAVDAMIVTWQLYGDRVGVTGGDDRWGAAGCRCLAVPAYPRVASAGANEPLGLTRTYSLGFSGDNRLGLPGPRRR